MQIIINKTKIKTLDLCCTGCYDCQNGNSVIDTAFAVLNDAIRFVSFRKLTSLIIITADAARLIAHGPGYQNKQCSKVR